MLFQPAFSAADMVFSDMLPFNLSAAVQTIEADSTRRRIDRYLGLMTHYGLTPTTNTPGQALRMRGSRDFAGRATYTN